MIRMSDHEKQLVPFENSEYLYTPRLQLDAKLLTEINQAPRGNAFTHGATPLDKLISMGSQEEVIARLLEYASVYPDHIPKRISRYAHRTLYKRFLGRADANDENFTTRVIQDYEAVLEPYLIEMVERAKRGNASPAELLVVRDVLGIRSIELACLTHTFGEARVPYATMGDALEDMRGTVRYAVEILDGTYYDEPENTRFRIKEAIGDAPGLEAPEDTPGLLMTRKRDLGELPDRTVVRERSSFILRIDPESKFYRMFGPEAIEKLKSTRLLPGKEQELALEEFEPVIAALIALNDFEEAVPISSTIFAFNEETTLVVEKAVEKRRLELEALKEAHDPVVEEYLMSEQYWIDQAQIELERQALLRFTAQARERLPVFLNGEIVDEDELS
jgi:hypothetical protein